MYYGYDTNNVLLVGFGADQEKKIKKLIVQDIDFQGMDVLAINDKEEDILQHLQSNSCYEAIFLNTNLDSIPLDSVCRTIHQQMSGGVILVTEADNQDCHNCFDYGISTVLRNEHMNEHTIKDALLSAKHNFDVRLKLRMAERRFADMISNSSDWLWEIDVDLNYVYFHMGTSNKGMYNTFQGEKFFNSFLPEEYEKLQDFFKRLIKKPEPFQNEEFWGRDVTGKVCWAISGVPVFNLKGDFIGFRGVSRNVSAEKESQREVYWLGNHDPITGLFNQARFFDEFGKALSSLKRYEREGVLAMIDIDQFKLINSHYGNEAGDEYLCFLGAKLKKLARKKDIVSRITSDQFVMMMPEMDIIHAKEKFDQFVKEISQIKLEYKKQNISGTISVGLISIPEHGKVSSELIRKAEVATTRAKETGRNRAHVFNPAEYTDSISAQNLELIDFVSDCLQNDRVAIYFQPIVLLADTKHIARYEVLMRMYDREGNIMPPAQLIEAAEKFGMNTKIDTVIATKAIEQAKKWYHEEGKRVVLAINLSGQSFDDDDLIAKLGKMVEDANLPEHTIVFEITETAALRDLSKAQKAIADLKAKGCCFALDDFGTGYASFHYVKNLDVDYIKIDGSFIRNIKNSSEDMVFVKALYNVANEMKIKTIAEMVEDLPTVEVLNEIGIDFAQGYYFGKPKPYLVE